MFDQPTYPQSWLDQRRARERQAAMFRRRRRQRLASLVLALVGLLILAWQLTSDDPNTAWVLSGMASVVPFVATFKVKL